MMPESMATPPIAAYIYDRCSTLATAALDERIERCRRYAVEHGWVVAGEWVDRADHALTNWPRPRWQGMAHAMRRAATGRVCLVDSWERISRERDGSAVLRRAVHLAGGYCVTAAGEDDLGQGRMYVAAPPASKGRP